MTSIPSATTLDLDEFRLVRMLGQGGMGAVYLGHDTVLEREVAIKVLRETASDADARLRFLTEARAIARLAHPNVIAIYRASTTRSGHPYLVQELVRGASLDRVPLPLEPRRALRVALGIARGLAAAHRRGILHRDVKPANVMLDETDTPKLLDFGVAKLSGVARSPASTVPARRVAGTVALAETLAETMDAPGGGATARTADAAAPLVGTAHGTVIGTPLYMAPEIWRGEPATTRSDLYSFGVLAYELASGSPPHAARDAEILEAAVLDGAPPRALGELVPALDVELAAIIMQCLARDVAERPESSDEVVHRLERALVGAPPIPEGDPYPGLAPFSGELRSVFYGRGSDIAAVVDRLRSDPLVVVAGESGIGKSSLCRAGVLPEVTSGALGDSRTWRARTIVIGRHALAALRDGLGLRDADASPTEIARALEASPTSGTLVLLDQLEELVTLNAPGEAAQAAALIAALASGVPGVKTVACVRGDFLTRIAALPDLGPLVTRSLHLLRVLGIAEVREAVAGPARAKGVRFESDELVERIAAPVADEPGALPLLSFALEQLWDRRDTERAVIPAAALEAIGGVAGALARHADGVLGALAAPERAAARRIVLQLITREGTRADRDRGELCPDDDPAAASALEALVRGRLVVARNTASGESSYALAHDSLIAAWSTLRVWRDDDAGKRVLRARLAAAADEWRRLGKSRDGLWNRGQLAEVATLDDLTIADRAFLSASRRHARARLAARAALIAMLPVVGLATWLAIRGQTRAARDREVAGHLATAEAHLRDAEAERDATMLDRALAFREFDAANTSEGEAAWARVRSHLASARSSYIAASAALEATLLLDGSRRDLRATMARTMYGYALLLEADRDRRAADEIATRLATVDDDGTLIGAWRMPARVLASAPGAAEIAVRRYDARDDRFEESAPVASASGPRLVHDLAPGSYVLVVRTSDGLTIRDPFVLERAEKLVLDIAVPRAAEVPAHMIYVPRGRFLLGSSSDDRTYRRDFLTAAPLHTVTTDAYLISRTEVTFADWLAYLRAVSPEERERRRPRTASPSGIAIALEGGSRPDEPFRLVFTVNGVATAAREGEPMHYADRTQRADVRWERMPVCGISFEDATAYAAWLAATDKLRGARMCSELEWERAARGADGRLWAHGDRLDPDDANIDVTYGRKTHAYGPDEVGVHPASTSPLGLVDTVGNVWEWVAGPHHTAVLRGGGWQHGVASAVIPNRDANNPSLRSSWQGMRLCATAPAP